MIPAKYVAVDLETTGLHPRIASIIEVGAVRFERGVEGESFTSLSRTSRRLAPEIAELTGIAPEEVAAAPPRAEVLAQLAAFCGRLPIVFHNARFDLGFLMHADRAWGKRRVFDTCTIARQAAIGSAGYGLAELARHFALEQKEAHRALPDARVTGLLFHHLCRAAPTHVAPTGVAKWIDPDERRPSHVVTRDLLDSGATLAEIAAERGLSPITVENHVTRLLRDGDVALERFLDPAATRPLAAAWRAVGLDGSINDVVRRVPGASVTAACWVQASLQRGAGKGGGA